MTSRRILLASALLALLPSAAAAGSVAGRLYLSRQAAAADSMGHKSSFTFLQSGVSDAVISVDSAPAGLERKLSKRAAHAHTGPHIDQANMQFVPRVMVLSAGDSVVFTNRDSLYHNVFSVSTACHFDVGRLPPGQMETVRFERAGVVNLHCELHPEMIGYVVVLPGRVYARPDSTGAFELPKLPRGHYVLRIWRPRYGEVSRAFDVPRHGGTNLALVL
jgi:plastocyanin